MCIVIKMQVSYIKLLFPFKPYSGWAFLGLLTDDGKGAGKKAPLPKISHTYNVTPYLKKIEKIYRSRDTPLEFC